MNDTFGCPDTDNDGWADIIDYFSNDSTQWEDQDGDGFGDNSNGFTPDSCPTIAGTSTAQSIYGCPDSDGDLWADSIDDLPNQSTQHVDSDGDGFGDNASGLYADMCPSVAGNSTENQFGCPDSDGDGYSDVGDPFSDDPLRWSDGDNDGFDDLVDDSCVTQYGT